MSKTGNKTADKDGRFFTKQSYVSSVTVAASTTQGSTSRKSRLHVVAVAVSFLISGFVMFSSVLTDITPKHECCVSDQAFLDNHTLPMGNKHRKECEFVLKSNLTLANNACEENATSVCSRWRYDQSYGSTFVSDFNLVCKDSWKKPFIQFAFLIGHIMGNLASGPLTDRYGRKVVFSISLLVGGFGRGLLSFVISYEAAVLLQFITGVGNTSHFLVGYVLAQELSDSSDLLLSSLEVNCMYSLGYLLVVPFSYLPKDWRWTVRVPMIMTATYIPVLWFIPESSKWKTEIQKGKQLKSSITTEYKMESEDNLLYKPNHKTDDPTPLVRMGASLLFRNSVLRNRFLVLCFSWIVGYLGYFTFNLNSSNLHGSAYINCSIGALVEIASAATMAFIVSRKGRRTSNVLAMGAGSILALLTPPIHHMNPLAGTVTSMLAKYFTNISLCITIQHTGELFPILLRNTAVGLAAMSAKIASIFAPFIVFAGEVIDISVPFYIMGGMFLLGSGVCTLLPETAGQELPDSLDKALSLETKRFKYTCLRRSHSSDNTQNNSNLDVGYIAGAK